MRNAVRRAEGIEANARVVARRADELCEDSRFDAARTLTIPRYEYETRRN